MACMLSRRPGSPNRKRFRIAISTSPASIGNAPETIGESRHKVVKDVRIIAVVMDENGHWTRAAPVEIVDPDSVGGDEPVLLRSGGLVSCTWCTSNCAVSRDAKTNSVM